MVQKYKFVKTKNVAKNTGNLLRLQLDDVQSFPPSICLFCSYLI